MKQIIKFISVFLLCTFVPLSAYSAEDGILITLGNNSAKASVSVYKSETVSEIKLIIASYSGKRLTAIKYSSKALNEGENNPEVSLPSLNGGKKVCAFLWDKNHAFLLKSASLFVDKNEAIYEKLLEIEEKIDKKSILDFFVSMYDPDTGGFYYSASGRDTVGFLPDVESTAQILHMFPEEEMPDKIKAKIGTWVQGLQSDDDGYFYHPQWGKEVNTERRDRDNTWALGVLQKCGMSPLYETAQERLQKRRKVMLRSVDDTNYLDSEENFKEWFNSLDFENSPYGEANKLNARYSMISAKGYRDLAESLIMEKQNKETGLWGAKNPPGMDEVSAVMKLHPYLDSFPNADKAIKSILYVLENYDSIVENSKAYIVHMYNAWVALGEIKSGCSESYLDEFYEKAPALLDIAYKNTEKFKRDDGGYSYMRDKSIGTAMSAPVSLGLSEGDVGSTTISHFHYISQAYGIIGKSKNSFFTKDEVKYFYDCLLNAPSIKKRQTPQSLTKDFENTTLYDAVIPSLINGSSLKITTDPQNAQNKCLHFKTSAAGQNGFYISCGIDAKDKRVVFETDIMFKNNKYPHIGLIRIGDKGYELRFKLDGTIKLYDKRYWSDKYPLTYVSDTTIKEDEWHKLKITIEPDTKIPENTVIRVYADGVLLNTNNRYYHNGYEGTEPSTLYSKILFESFMSTDGEVYFDNIRLYSEEKSN